MAVNYSSAYSQMIDGRFLAISSFQPRAVWALGENTKYTYKKIGYPNIVYTSLFSFYILNYILLAAMVSLPVVIVLAVMGWL